MGRDRDLTRFLSKVDKHASGCWNWTGARMPRGYGRFYFKGKLRYAHRVAIELLAGLEVPDASVVLHSCDNPQCVNPAHLAAGTQADNMRDAATKGRCVNVSDWSGASNPKAKLTAEQAGEVRCRAVAGESTRALAREFGITITRVQQIRKAANGGVWLREEF